MTRANLKLSQETKFALDEVKRDGETWDDCLQRLVELHRVAAIQDENP